MNLPLEIKTISHKTEFKLKEKGSIFIAKSFPINSEKEIEQELNSIKKEYYDATHHCYSYQLQNGNFKYSDDGEPNGTAGLRIYNAQNHFELKNILTIVIRYFGGTKLGVGPLGKAYYESAFGSLSNSRIKILQLYQSLIISYDYSQSKNIHYLINKYDIKIINNDFSQSPKIVAFINTKIVNQFEEEVKKFLPLINPSFKENFEYFEKKTSNIWIKVNFKYFYIRYNSLLIYFRR